MKWITLASLTVGLNLLSPAALAQFEAVWTTAHRTGAADRHMPSRLIATPDGGVLALMRTLPIFSTGNVPIFGVAKFSADGDRQWGIDRPSLSGAFFSGPLRIDGAVDAAGNLFVFAGGPSGQELLRIDPDGQILWSTPAPNIATYAGLAIDASGDLIVTGTFIGPGIYPFAEFSKFDVNGNLLFTSESRQTQAQGLAIGPTGQIAVFGNEDFLEEYQWGYVIMFEAAGTVRWERNVASDGFVTPFQSEWYDHLNSAVFDPAGNFHTPVNGNLHRGPIGALIDTRGTVLHGLDAATGQTLYRVEMEGSAEARVEYIAIDPTGTFLVMTGWETDCVANCPFRMVVRKYDLAGNEIWSQRPSLAQAVDSRGVAVRVDALGRVHASGVLDSGSTSEALDVVFAPDGTELWSRTRPAQDFDINAYQANRVRNEIAFDDRGNRFSVSEISEGLRVVKHVDGSPVGSAYCGPAVPNSSGASGEIRVLGSDVRSADNITLALSSLPANTFSLFLTSQTQGMTQMVGGGQGTLCLGGTIGRFALHGQIRRTEANGTTSLQLDLDRIASPAGPRPVFAGQTWNFQAWFRDANPATTSNLTNAVQVTLQ